MIKIISDIEKREYNPKNYNSNGNVLDTTNFRFTYNDKIYDYIKYEIKNNENEKDVAIHIYSEEQGPIYINPRHEESSFVGISECFEKLNKEEITLDFFNELKEANLVPNSLNYDDIYANNHKEFFSKQYKDEKETDIYKISNHKTGVYQITTDFMFKHDNQFFTLKLKHDLDEERNKNTKLFKLYLNDENGDKISNLGDLYVSNGKKIYLLKKLV